MKKLLVIAEIFLLSSVLLHAQGEVDEQQKAFFRNEKSIGILLNTDGIGVSYRSAKRIDFLNKRLWEIDAGTLKHSKEYRQPNLYSQGGSFIFGKLNSTFFIRGGIGHQHELFKKTDIGGIAIRYFYSVGPVLAIYKPVYYKVIYYRWINPTQFIPYEKEEKFDVSIALPQDISGRASFFKGFDEVKVMPGLYAKGGFNFEYSKEDKVIHAVEIGAQINAFPKEIPIMANTDNKAIYFSLFVSYRFGIIINPLDPESNKISNIFRRKKKN